MITDNPNNVGVAFFSDADLIPAIADHAGDALASQFTLAVRSSSPDWLRHALDQVDGLQRLQANWDSYDASAIRIESALLAREFLKWVAQFETVEPPAITASPDGNVGLCWDDGHRSIDIEVLPEGLLDYDYANRASPQWDEEGVTNDPDRVVFLLTRL